MRRSRMRVGFLKVIDLCLNKNHRYDLACYYVSKYYGLDEEILFYNAYAEMLDNIIKSGIARYKDGTIYWRGR